MIHPVRIPGQYVSVENLDPLLPGFIYHIKGNPTKNRYRAATVSVDHLISLIYVQLKRNLTYNETFKSKKFFEAYSRK